MALLDVMRGNFSNGEMSPLMLARLDVERVRNAAALLDNWLVLTQGGVTRRPGLRYVATAKHADRLCLVRPFEPSTTEAYILEVGHEYLRFYRDGARIEVASVPVEVATPYAEDDLRLLRTAQSNDVMILVHPTHAPRRLSRLSDTDWTLSPINFRPPPLYEAGIQLGATITLSTTSGLITITASNPVFLPADKHRQITAGVGRATITTVTDASTVTAQVIDTFAGTTFVVGTWTLEGSPVADLTPDVNGPVGAIVTLTLSGAQPDKPNLVSNGDFGTGDLTDWTNHSGATVATGTHTGAADSASLVDSAADFLVSGVQATHIVTNTTDGSSGQVAAVGPTSVTLASPGLLGGTEDDFDLGDAYTIRQTGSAAVSGGSALLRGGTAGIGWIEQELLTVAGTRYHVTFRVSDAPVAMMIGSTSQTSDVLAEASYPVGEHELTFVATGTDSFLQFRNNQDTTAKVGAIAVRETSLPGFRLGDGDYIRLHDGLVRITSFGSSTLVQGEILKELSTTDPTVAGAWTLESSAWSDTLGWPSAVVLYEGRLFFAGSTRFPQTIWGSAIDDFFNFAIGANDADAVAFSLVDSGGNITLNRIRWLMPAENMLVGTTHGEYRLIGSGDDPLTPRTPPRVRVQSTFGSDTVQPLKVGAAILFAQRQGSKVREMAFDERSSTTFLARDITVLSSHLLQDARVVDLAYQQEPLSVVWGVRSDGVGLPLTYDLSEQVVAWARLTTQGSLESVATIPHPSANAHQVWFSVQRTLDGAPIRFLEYLDAESAMTLPVPVTDPESGEVVSGWQGLTVDAGVVWSGNSPTITGLDHLEGATVQVVANGAVFPETTVASGQITLSQTVQRAFVGLGYSARGQTLPVELPVRGNTGQVGQKRWVKLTARLYQSLCLVLHAERLQFRARHMPMGQGLPPFTGDKDITPLGWSRKALISFVADQPLPCTVLGIIGTVDAAAEAQTAPEQGRAA